MRNYLVRELLNEMNEDKLSMIDYETSILLDKINKVEMAAVKNKQERLMFTCESRKANLINLMIYLQEKYL